ncbi:MAG: NUDIX domain-containing protein [Pseudomonadota bacterium]
MNQTKRYSAGVVIIRDGRDEPEYLLLRAFKHWDFPKGMVEAGEQPLETAIREVEEETTLRDIEFLWGNDFIETPPYNRGKVARFYVAQWRSGNVDLPVNPDLGWPEHHAFEWMTFERANDVLVERLRDVLSWARAMSSP